MKRLLLSILFLFLFSTQGFADSQSKAFEKLVTIVRTIPNWREKDAFKDKMLELGKAAGFSAIFDNTLVKQDENFVTKAYVIIEKRRLVYVTQEGERVFASVDQALEAIYGVHKL
jgi:hypothetical protein